MNINKNFSFRINQLRSNFFEHGAEAYKDLKIFKTTVGSKVDGFFRVGTLAPSDIRFGSWQYRSWNQDRGTEEPPTKPPSWAHRDGT